MILSYIILVFFFLIFVILYILYTMFYFTILYVVILYYVIVEYSILYFSIIYYIALYCLILYVPNMHPLNATAALQILQALCLPFPRAFPQAEKSGRVSISRPRDNAGLHRLRDNRKVCFSGQKNQ